MSSSIKLLLWLFAGISTLLAVLVALIFFVDANLYRTQIEQQVSAAFGREVILEGSLSLEPSLTPRLVVNGLKISNPDWASRPFLAVVDKFDIRVSLLPLLRGDLEIESLEFYGVDLLLEEGPGGTNNFTFGDSSGPAGLPAIERMSLYNAAIAYAALERPVRRLHLEQVIARKVPGQPVELEAHTTVNAVPVTISLRGEPTGDRHPYGPWQITLLGEAGDLSLRVEGSVAGPTDFSHGEYRLDLKGQHLDDIEALSGVTLPEAGPYELSANIQFNLYEYLMVSDLNGQLGASDIHGNLRWDMSTSRSVIKARLDSQQLDASDMGIGDPLTRNTDQGNPAYDGVDLDIEIQVQRLDGLTKPVQDIVLTAHADRQHLRLVVDKATIDGIHISASAALPWGERLAALGKDGVSMQRLMQHADVALKARVPDGKLHYHTNMMGHPVDLGLTSFEATARPGEVLQVSAKALLDDTPILVNLRAEPLAQLLQRPAGPWQDLALDVEKGDIRFHATGSVERPFEASGFDADYELSGAEINTLLPLFNLILPLEGAYSLTGHFADLPDRIVFDQLKIKSGSNDISGDISVYQDTQRPRVVANLSSEQIFLSTLLPVNETEAAPDAKRYVIPDYNLPIERMREIDGELTFTGKRLRTTAGDLGDISFKATLQDGVFRMNPFQVRGWAGALIESDIRIDASQDPPEMHWQWIARQLNYGVLLEQAGFAETVEGTIDITLRLSGNGRTRREFLGDADGQLIIVGQDGKFGSRRLDLWGSDLLTTMLSSKWRNDDVTNLNCVIARIDIKDGIARSDKLLIDTRRITIAATGTLNLESEELNLAIAPRPRRASLVSLTNPVQVTGTLAVPEVSVTVLPSNRRAVGTGLLAGLINPGLLIFTFSQTGSGQANSCVAAVEETLKMKGKRD